MKKIISLLTLILVSSMILGGMTNTAQAQNDPSILLKIAKQAQEQLQNQINQNSPDTIKQLFKNGTQQVMALEKSLGNNETNIAKEQFLSAMRIFKQVSQQLIYQTPKPELLSNKTTIQDPSGDILRMQDYSNNLKSIAKKYNTLIDFSELDALFVTAKKQATDNQFDESQQTITKIKQMIVDLNKNIREQSSPHQQSRAKEYAQTYIEQLDRLIENAKNQKLSEDIIKRLETARENLSLATDPHEIIKQVREIISIKTQFDLTKNDRLESRVIQIEKTLLNLSNSNQLNQTDIEDAKTTLQTIKRLLSQGEVDMANELLRSLTTLLD
jgi:hypothetical protein